VFSKLTHPLQIAPDKEYILIIIQNNGSWD